MTQKTLDTLHYNTLLSNQVFKVDAANNLHIVEFAPLKKRNETIPLDLIDAKPSVKKKPDSHLIFLASISAIACSYFFLTAHFFNQSWAIAFGVLFLLTSIASIFSAYKNNAVNYTYHFINTNTELFTLRESFSENRQVEMFVNALNKRISTLTEQPVDSSHDGHDSSNDLGDDKYKECRKHLDFLYNHDFVDDALYQRLDSRIHNRFSTKDHSVEKPTTENIIYFPVKA